MCDLTHLEMYTWNAFLTSSSLKYASSLVFNSRHSFMTTLSCSTRLGTRSKGVSLVCKFSAVERASAMKVNALR